MFPVPLGPEQAAVLPVERRIPDVRRVLPQKGRDLLVGHSPALAQQKEQHLELEHPTEPQMLIHNGCRHRKRRPHIFKIDTVFQNPTVPFRHKHYVKSVSFTLKKWPVSRLFTHKPAGGPLLLSFIRQGYYSTF